jgi:protein-S-isoprenylcysteine O-methyltransferase Ste14
MDIIFIIAIGVSGFILILFFDILMLKKVPGIKFILWVFGTGMILCSTVLACLSENKLNIPNWTPIPGWILFAIGIVLIAYSLFVNIPFRQTYVAEGNSKLVRTGLYALCRHPGTYWAVLFLFGLVLVSRTVDQLIIALLFVVLNTILVIVEDKYIFPKIFPDYIEYKKNTPMLFPSAKSINDFILQLRK